MSQVCFIRENVSHYVEDVCPQFDKNGRKICHLTGCGPIIIDYLSNNIKFVALFISTLTFALVTGLIFILQITFNFRHTKRKFCAQVCIAFEKVLVNLRQTLYSIFYEKISNLNRGKTLTISMDDLDSKDPFETSPFKAQNIVTNREY